MRTEVVPNISARKRIRHPRINKQCNTVCSFHNFEPTEVRIFLMHMTGPEDIQIQSLSEHVLDRHYGVRSTDLLYVINVPVPRG